MADRLGAAGRGAGPGRRAAGLLALGAVLALCGAGRADDGLDRLNERIRVRLEAAGEPPRLAAAGERILSAVAVRRFYRQRVFRPAWATPEGPSASAWELLEVVEGAGDEGLYPDDYHAASLREALAAGTPPEEQGLGKWADLELLLTDAFILYASHCLHGRIDPETIDPSWMASLRDADFGALLENALAGGGVRETLNSLLPREEGYARLRSALADLRRSAEAGGWPPVSPGPTLRTGDRGDRVLELRARLRAGGDLAAGPETEEERFSLAVEGAVKAFQARHGLDADGAVGAKTLEALNVSAADRMEQAAVNLERWRWLPEELGARHVLVNIADFRLEASDGGEKRLEMRVIVGRTYRRTPVFSDRMRYMVFNPSWEVPPRLAAQDKLPLIRRDPTYLAREGFRVLAGWGAEQKEVDPATVDWTRVGSRAFPYRLRQEPGPTNALGRVKFMFPNKHNVYLHDTSTPELFAGAARTLSSGCVRVERPLDLAEFVLAADPRWSRERIEATIAEGAERTVPLAKPVPVHIVYQTAWVDPSGALHFRPDVYGRDRAVAEALRAPPPPPNGGGERSATR